MSRQQKGETSETRKADFKFFLLSDACVTPIGMAIGLGVRHSYQGNSVTALVTSGILDSISAGILLWTGLVELLAHEFLFSEEMREASNWKVFYAL